MTSSDGSAGGDGAIPVACTLTGADRTAQEQRWLRLAARAMTGRADTPDGVRLGFRPDGGVREELSELAAVERECCGWADWTVTADAGQVVLTVRASGAGVTALHDMFTGLRRR